MSIQIKQKDNPAARMILCALLAGFSLLFWATYDFYW